MREWYRGAKLERNIFLVLYPASKTAFTQPKEVSMKKISVMCVAMAALFTLLSCNDVNGNASEDAGTAPLKGRVKQLPDEPAPVIIDDDVKEWMAGQVAAKSNERKLVIISEMYLSSDDRYIPNLSVAANSNGKVQYFSNGKEISVEEYKSILESIGLDQNGKRNLSIPGEIISSDARTWTVLITAEEIAGLSKKYDNLLISFYPDYHESLAPEND
jgi:hypothetical protein